MGQLPTGDWMTAADVAAELGLSKPRVHALVRAGRLPAMTVGNLKLFTRADVAAFKAVPRAAGRPAAKPPKKSKP